MTAIVKQHNVDRVGVIPRNRKLNRSGRILSDQTQNRKLSQVRRVDQTNFGMESPIAWHREHDIPDISASLVTGQLLDVPQDHRHNLFQCHRFVTIFEDVGVPFEFVPRDVLFRVQGSNKLVQIEVGQFRFF